MRGRTDLWILSGAKAFSDPGGVAAAVNDGPDDNHLVIAGIVDGEREGLANETMVIAKVYPMHSSKNLEACDIGLNAGPKVVTQPEFLVFIEPEAVV